MNSIFAIASVVIKELYRRKDFYVLFVLTALITLLMGSVSFFDDKNIARFLKDICLLLIWVSALVIAVVTTARQIPAEREQRTIFPLLAKPVTRGQVLVGKFAGCWLACGLALVVFYLFFGVISASREQHWPLAQFLKGFWLQWDMLAIVVALALLGSVVFTAPSSNSTICFIVVVGILLLGGHLNQVALQQVEPWRSILYSIYYLIPHLEWYNQREALVNNRDLAAWSYCAEATGYAALYVATVLYGAWLVFRRKTLTL
jgi:ABC-type transport system involved in multi-copper enzyme maturation permease subunit